MRRVRHAHRRRRTGDLLDDHEVLEEAEPGAPVSLGHGRTHHAELPKLRPEPPREGVVAVDLLGLAAPARARRTRERSHGAPRRRCGRSMQAVHATARLQRPAASAVRWPAMTRVAGARTSDPTSREGSRDNARAMHGLVDELNGEARHGSRRAVARRRPSATAARGKLTARERIERLVDPGAAFLELSPLAAVGHVRGRGAGRRHRHRHRADPRLAVRDRRQRRHGEGRHLLPDDGEEAPARPGDRAGEPACPASTWWIRAARSCRCRPRSSPIAITSAASSTTRRACRRRASRRSPR